MGAVLGDEKRNEKNLKKKKEEGQIRRREARDGKACRGDITE